MRVTYGRRTRRLAQSDAGAVGVAWLTKLAAVVAVVGVLGFDGFAVMSARIKGEDDAQNAAYAASTAWQQSHNVQAAYAAAQQYVAGKDETILTTDFSIDPDNTVHLMLQRHAQTILFSRIGPLHKYTVETVRGDDNANPP